MCQVPTFQKLPAMHGVSHSMRSHHEVAEPPSEHKKYSIMTTLHPPQSVFETQCTSATSIWLLTESTQSPSPVGHLLSSPAFQFWSEMK
jgi:hypothetical protein